MFVLLLKSASKYLPNLSVDFILKRPSVRFYEVYIFVKLPELKMSREKLIQSKSAKSQFNT